MRPVSLPAICRCMFRTLSGSGDTRHQGFPRSDPAASRNSSSPRETFTFTGPDLRRDVAGVTVDTMYPGTWARTTPDKPALILVRADGSSSMLTYAELDDRSLRLANRLRASGLRRGDVVALLSDNTTETYEVYWAALRSGLYITAVNHNLSAGEASYIVTDCGAKALVVSAAKAVARRRARRRRARAAGVRRPPARLRRLRGRARRRRPRPAARAAARRRPALLLRHHRAAPRASSCRCPTTPSTSRATSTSRSSAASTASTPRPSTSRRRRSTTRRRCASAASSTPPAARS